MASSGVGDASCSGTFIFSLGDIDIADQFVACGVRDHNIDQDMNTPALMTIHGAAGRDVVIIDFSNSSRTADMAFKGRGGTVVNCDHGGGHCGGSPLAPSIWQFFKDHTFGTDKPWTAIPTGIHASCKMF